MAKVETIAWEHSEPGTGPTPVYDTYEDKAMINGWRLDPYPAAYPGQEDPFLSPVAMTLQFEYESTLTVNTGYRLPYEAREGG